MTKITETREGSELPDAARQTGNSFTERSVIPVAARFADQFESVCKTDGARRGTCLWLLPVQ